MKQKNISLWQGLSFLIVIAAVSIYVWWTNSANFAEELGRMFAALIIPVCLALYLIYRWTNKSKEA